jgi:hypothetical protein
LVQLSGTDQQNAVVIRIGSPMVSAKMIQILSL